MFGLLFIPLIEILFLGWVHFIFNRKDPGAAFMERLCFSFTTQNLIFDKTLGQQSI